MCSPVGIAGPVYRIDLGDCFELLAANWGCKHLPCQGQTRCRQRLQIGNDIAHHRPLAAVYSSSEFFVLQCPMVIQCPLSNEYQCLSVQCPVSSFQCLVGENIDYTINDDWKSSLSLNVAWCLEILCASLSDDYPDGRVLSQCPLSLTNLPPTGGHVTKLHLGSNMGTTTGSKKWSVNILAKLR